jgi:hypothetical protein
MNDTIIIMGFMLEFLGKVLLLFALSGLLLYVLYQIAKFVLHVILRMK